jgi:hypothetical protein
MSRTAISDAGMLLYSCNLPTGYSNRGVDWLNLSAQLYRMNFALDLSANRIGGVTVDTRALARGLSAPVAIGNALAQDVFAGTLTRQTLDAAARVDTRTTNPTAASRVTGLLLASPEFQVR